MSFCPVCGARTKAPFVYCEEHELVTERTASRDVSQLLAQKREAKTLRAWVALPNGYSAQSRKMLWGTPAARASVHRSNTAGKETLSKTGKRVRVTHIFKYEVEVGRMTVTGHEDSYAEALVAAEKALLWLGWSVEREPSLSARG